MKAFAILAAIALSVVASADLKKLQGTWKPFTGKISGHLFPGKILGRMTLVIKGKSYDYDEGNGHDVGTLKEIPGKKPLAFDIVGIAGPTKGRTIPAIYKFDGAALTICYGLDGKRPKAFESKQKTLTLLLTFRKA